MIKHRNNLFWLVILLVGIITCFFYGEQLDQPSEQRITAANIKEYLIQIPGDSPAIVDELTEQGVIEISIDEDRDHGMAEYYPVAWVWQLNQVTPYWGNIVWHIYTFLLVFGGMYCLYLLMNDLLKNEYIAKFTVLLFWLTPRMFAESHYNDKDIILLSLLFALFYWLTRLMKKVSFKTIFMFAFIGALVSNIKIVGMWFFGVLGIYTVIYFVVTKQFTKKLLGQTIGCVLLWAVIYILLTPACWTDPVAFFQYLFGYAIDYDLWKDYVLFNGRLIQKDYTGMPRKYLPVLITITTPVGILLLTVWGYMTLGIELLKSKGKKLLEQEGLFLVFAIVVGVPLVYAVLAATPLYNSWRHFYFVYAAMITGAGYGAFRIYKLCEKGPVGCKRVVQVTGAVYLSVLAIGIMINFPHEHSYFNFLAGDNIVERFELDYWDLSTRQAYESILEDIDEEESKQFSVGALNLPTMWGLEGNWNILPKRDKSKLYIEENWENADYIIINTTYAVMYSQDQYQQIKDSYEMIDAFSSYGNVIYEVYRRD